MPFQAKRDLSFFFAGILAIGMFLYVLPLISPLPAFWDSQFQLPFFALLFVLGAILLGVLYWSLKPISSWISFTKRLLLLFLPTEIVLIVGSLLTVKIHYLMLFPMGVYLLVTFGLWATIMHQTYFHIPTPSLKTSLIRWFRTQGMFALLFVGVVTGVFFSFGLKNLTHFAAVDEPLWTDGRIGKFWKHIGNRNWEKTRVSDKPGITIALAAGPGLWFVTPKEYRESRAEFSASEPNRSIEELYLAFRLPLLIVITMFLPVFYLLTERLLGRMSALIIYPCIILSPILVGTSKIINPDSLLWVFAPLSFLAYLVFLERERFFYLILSGIFLGLAILTKYVANILFVFSFALPFLEYLYHQKNRLLPFTRSLQKNLAALGVVVGTSMITFYVLLPAVWVKPEKLLTSTLYSQAFEKVAPLFLFILMLLSADTIFFRGRGSENLMHWLSHFEKYITRGLLLIFLGSLFFVLLSPQFGMPWFHFETLLASPKTVSQATGILGIFLTNFYPLAFGITPLTLFGLFISGIFLLRKNILDHTPARTVFYSILFILLYYCGATANGVAMIARYQIMIYPIVGLLGGIGLIWFVHWCSQQFPLLQNFRHSTWITPLMILGLFVGTLALTPFPMSYASTLLPDQYHIDVKDMGGGSYEAAQYLNSLPNASELLIWTDKSGVCKFFIGRCEDGFNFDLLRAGGLDYIVVSAGRASRTGKMMINRMYNPTAIRFDTYYKRTDPEFQVQINGRSSDFVKVFRFVP